MDEINQTDREIILSKKNNIKDWKIKISDISIMDFNDLDQHIDDNVIDIASVKLYLKKLSRAVLGLMKLFEEKDKRGNSGATYYYHIDHASYIEETET